MLREIGRACQALEGHSIAGRPRDELRIGMRSVLVHPYVIFFRTTDLSVEIVRILHQRRDIDTIFANDLDV